MTNIHLQEAILNRVSWMANQDAYSCDANTTCVNDDIAAEWFKTMVDAFGKTSSSESVRSLPSIEGSRIPQGDTPRLPIQILGRK